MSAGKWVRLNLRSQVLCQDERGRNVWRYRVAPVTAPAGKLALILCDMWDNHWSRGAAERCAELAVRMDEVVRAARALGAHIIHAPSECMEHYADHPARRRVLELPPVALPEAGDREDPPLPIDDSDGGSDTGEQPWWKAWTRQHAAIGICDQDAIADQGEEVYRHLVYHEIERLVIAGVHTNMCVLNRSFGIKQMVRWGVPIALARDLTDTMYNPARPPYVSHEEGTRLVVEFIEKHWCPTVLSHDLMSGW